MDPGDIAFKSNFATMDASTGIVVQRRADRQFEEEGPVLCAALDNMSIPGYPDYSINVKYATEHRCGVVIRGPLLTDAISGTDPLKDNLPLLAAQPLEDSHEALRTADVVNAASDAIRAVLERHPINEERKKRGKCPANVVLLRGCGCRLALKPFELLHGMRAAIVSPTKIIAGLGMCAGMDVLNVPGTTGDYRTLFHKKAAAIAQALIGNKVEKKSVTTTTTPCSQQMDEEMTTPHASIGTSNTAERKAQKKSSIENSFNCYDFAFLHVKAVDDAGHDGNVGLKVAYISVVDTMIGQLIRLLWQHEQQQAHSVNHAERNDTAATLTSQAASLSRYTIVVTGDHSTPVEFTDHSHEPVPFAIAHVRDVVHAIGGTAMLEQLIPGLGEISHPAPVASNGTDAALSVSNSSFTSMNGKANGSGHGMHGARSMNVQCSSDPVCRFSEIDAVQGVLGRFPGSQVMPLIQQFARRSVLD